MAVAVIMLTGCRDDEADAIHRNKSVSVELAYAFTSSVTGYTTRQDIDMVANNATRPRRPESLRIIPMVNDAPGKAIIRWEETVGKDDPKSLFYRYRYCDLPINTNGFLIYGQVGDLTPAGDINPKMYNGSLIETLPVSITTVEDVQEGIGFNLEPIYKSTDYESTNGIPAGAKTLADCLTAIAKAGNEVDGYFNTSSDVTIKAHFDRFTNDGNHLPGSAASVRKWIETFQTSISGSLSNDILNAVNAEATTQLATIASLTYPRDISLPDGAAVLRWDRNTNRFEPQINTTTIDNINSMARFAYPAPLYYYIASAIKASEDKVDFASIYSEVETDDNKTAWEKVLANANFNKTAVSANTKAVALVRPIQYAVAQLKVRIKAYAETLKDAKNENVTVTGNQFPLTGIVVCDQRPVGYRFLPKEVAEGTISDANVLFIYDSQVQSGCYLNPQDEGVWTEGCNTLVLQSLKDEDVNVILEFENNSGLPFTCLDGIVYPGTRFYLIGRIEAALYNTPDPNVHDENKGQVFTKDYITTVNMTVSSLARAYNVPPNLLSPNLEIGVETTPQWVAATPTVIRME